jgi:fructokinase
MLEIVCWGELLWDLFEDGPRLGGASANVAYHLAKLGAEVRLVSRVGDDELGRRALAILASHGVDVSGVQIDPGRPTGTVNVTLEGDEPRYTIRESAAWEQIELASALAPVLARASAIVYGTLAQRTPLANEALLEALAMVRGPRVLDLNLRPSGPSRDVVLSAISSATVVKLNESEHASLGRILDTDDPSRALLERGVKLIALTRGARGAVLRTKQAELEHPGFAASGGGDSVGAGDAFTAVLTLGLCRGSRLAAILARANLHAALTASRRGAMPELDGAWLARLDRQAPW